MPNPNIMLLLCVQMVLLIRLDLLPHSLILFRWNNQPISIFELYIPMTHAAVVTKMVIYILTWREIECLAIP